MTLISNEYKTLYIESLQTITVKEHIRQIARVVQRKMQCNYNPETRLRNNDRYAKAVVYIIEYKDISSLNYIQFIRTLKREVGFKDKRSSIYYYTKTADSWTYIRILTEAR
ncbi:hypothetical protein HBI51_099980 [Parastagonospora nodorum]|nr:hypothetical protein HBI51_099980 [Parastagonospora nodorum]